MKIPEILKKGTSLAVAGLIIGQFVMGIGGDIGSESIEGLGSGLFLAAIFGGVYLTVKKMVDVL